MSSLPSSVSPKIKYLQIFIGDTPIKYRFISKDQIDEEITKSKERSCTYVTKIYILTEDNVLFNSLGRSKGFKAWSIKRPPIPPIYS